METIKQLNPTLWAFAAVLITWVVVQSGLFVKLALDFNKKNNLMTKEQLKNCVKIGSTSVIGPAMNAVAISLSMVGLVGSADTFMRCGVIGAATQEMFLAQQAAAVAGVEFGSAAFTPSIMTFVIWMQVWGTIPFFLHLLISIKPLDMAATKGVATGKKAGGPTFMQFMGAAAPMALMPYFMAGYFTNAAQRTCVIASLAAGFGLYFVQKKTGSKFLANFSMIICMIIGCVAGELATPVA